MREYKSCPACIVGINPYSSLPFRYDQFTDRQPQSGSLSILIQFFKAFEHKFLFFFRDTASGIRYSRNTPDMTAASSIRLANSGSYDFYLALHSNGSTDGTKEGAVRGVIAFYYPTSANGRRAADIFVKNLKDIYPMPDKVYARATTTLGEVRQPYMPSVLLELGYHDNTADARWIEDNIQAIAANLVLSLTEYFGLPFVTPITPWQGTVQTPGGGPLNLRAAPGARAEVVTLLPNGAKLTVYGRYQEWYTVGYQGRLGYAYADFIQ